jgi:hypothetical protein
MMEYGWNIMVVAIGKYENPSHATTHVLEMIMFKTQLFDLHM